MTFNLFRPILAILLLFIPLYPKFPLSFAQGAQVAFRLDDIIIALVFLIYLVNQIKNRFPILKLKVTWVILAYLIAITLSSLNAFLIYQTTPTHILLLHLLRRFQYISLFFVTLEAIKTRRDFKFIYLFTCLAFIGVFAYGIGQKYFNLPIISTMNFEFAKGQLLQMNFWSRISSTFAGHYDLAAYLSVISVIFFGVFLSQKNKLYRFFSFILWLMAFYLLTLTAARISTFAYWGGVTLLCLLLKRFVWIIPTSLLVVLSIVSSKDLNQRLLATIPSIKPYFSQNIAKPTPATIPTITPVLTPIPTSKIQDLTSKISPIPTVFRHKPEEFPPVDADAGVARSGEIRFNVEWPRAITAFNKNKLLGTAPGSITLATDNDYLRSLGETGLLGFVTFCLIFVYFFINLIKKSTALNLVFATAILIVLVNAIFIDIFEASKTAYLFWMMMAVFYKSETLNDSKG
jgi:hypothetical protein